MKKAPKSRAKGKKKPVSPKPKARRRPKKGPRSQVLPGMEQVRNGKLDNICESIAEERARKNKAAVEETGLVTSALEVMQRENITIYKHGGVELARVPGAEKLRIRLTKDQGDAEVSDGTTSSAGDEGGE